MNWEFSVLYALQELHNPILDAFMVFISSLGDDGILWIAIGVICLFFKKHRKMGLQLLLSMLCTFIIGNLILKNVFQVLEKAPLLNVSIREARYLQQEAPTPTCMKQYPGMQNVIPA